MKKRILWGILILGLSQFSLDANGIPEFKVENGISSGIIKIDQNKWNAGDVRLQIVNKYGEIIYSDKISQDKVSQKRFLMDGMENGLYTLNWIDDLSMISQQMRIEDSMPVLLDHSYEVFYKPVVKLNGRTIEISMLSLKTPIHLKLYDPLGNMIFDEEVENQDQYQQRLKIVQPMKGHYTITANSNKHSFRDHFEIKN